MNFSQFIVQKFNQEADSALKVKVMLGTLFDTALSTLLSMFGIVGLFKLDTNSVWVYVTLFICSIGYFHLFRLWHTVRIIEWEENAPPQQKPDAEG